MAGAAAATHARPAEGVKGRRVGAPSMNGGRAAAAPSTAAWSGSPGPPKGEDAMATPTAQAAEPCVEQLKDTAVRAALLAGEIQWEHFGQALTVDSVRKHDVTLEVDRLCEEAILDRIRRAFPDHALVTEESGTIAGPADYVWYVDPLDGTVNFYHGLPCFCASVACYRRPEAPAGGRDASLASLGEPLVGVIYAPGSDELFVGVRGQGATCNGEPIRAGAERQLGEAIVALALGSAEQTMQHMEHTCSALVRRVRQLRMFGSAGLDLAHVACGRLSGLVQAALPSWDFAAGRVVLEESGGVLHARQYAPGRWYLVASCPGIHAELKASACPPPAGVH